MRRQTLAINLLSIDGGQLSGIGYYGVALFEQMLQILGESDAGIDLIAFIRPSAERHFSVDARSKLITLPFDGGRVKRVLFEQAVFPFHLMSKGVDILINPAFTGPLWGARKRVTVVHDMYFKVIPEMLERYQRIYLNLFVPLNCRLSWKILTDSNSSANDLIHFYPYLKERVAAVALASRFEDRGERPIASSPGGDPYILMVANLTANKNPAAAVRAVSILRARGRPFRLVHVGADKQGRLKAAIEANDAAGWTQSLRNIGDDELLALYRGALCLVVPSFYEGFGLPVLEGQQAGVPVVCSDRSSLPEVGGDAALYFDPGNPSELADCLAKIADDETLRSGLVRRGYENAARFSWRKTAGNTLHHLELLRRPRERSN